MGVHNCADAQLALASRRLPGFAIGEHTTPSWPPTLEDGGGDVGGVIFHSDKGSEYTADLFAQTCKALGVTQSMGRVGSALENAAAESFNSTLEFELLDKHRFATKAEVQLLLAGCIDTTRRVSGPYRASWGPDSCHLGLSGGLGGSFGQDGLEADR